jgi:hypothetical protein
VDIAELLARESIRDLVARYNSLGDRGRSQDVADLFAPNGVLSFREEDDVIHSVGRTKIVERLESFKADFAARLRGTGGPGRLYHSVSTHVIDLVDTDYANGRAYVTVLSDHGLFEWGQYTDSYVRSGDRWLFARREARRFGITA